MNHPHGIPSLLASPKTLQSARRPPTPEILPKMLPGATFASGIRRPGFSRLCTRQNPKPETLTRSRSAPQQP